MDNSTLYPLKFVPILKEKIWGGTKLKSILNKNLKSNKTGESWEVSSVKGDISIIANGYLKGKNLQDILSEYKEELVGKRVYSTYKNEFPLLVKFIDAQDDLSIQVHPGDKIAKERHNSFGKTEMWYVIDSDKGSELISGFNQTINKETYQSKLKSGKVTDIVNSEEVKSGDVFSIPVGRVHAIKSGILLAEIQQTSDITYRIYDWNRVDDKGNKRELHTEYALDALDYKKYDNYKTDYTIIKNERILLDKNLYFETNLFELTENKKLTYYNIDSFVIYMIMEGEVNIKFDKGSINAKKGESVLIPAIITELELELIKETKLLEVYIPK